MKRRQQWTGVLYGLLVVASLPAQQVAIGSMAPAMDVKRWAVRGDIPAVANCPRLICFVPEARLAYRRAMGTLLALQHAVGKQIATVAVLPTCRADALLGLRLLKARTQCSVVVDRSDRTRAAFSGLFDSERGIATVLIDAHGILVWRGSLGDDLRYLIEDLHAGRLAGEQGQALAELQRIREVARRTRSWHEALERAHLLARALPGHWLPLVVELDAIGRADLGAGAKVVWQAAASRLRNRPEYLARVLLRVLERRPAEARDETFAEVFTSVIRANSKSIPVARACLEYFSARNEYRIATTWAFRWLECAKSDPIELVTVARHLSRGGKADRFADVSLLAYDLALNARPDDSDLLHAKFDLLIQHKKDFGGADSVGRRIVDLQSTDARYLNSFAWRLLTEPPYIGKMAPLALYAGEKMAAVKGWRAYWRIDTLAFAMFVNGRIEAAIELQKEAVEGCDSTSRSRYEVRLDRYVRAQAARATVPATPGK